MPDLLDGLRLWKLAFPAKIRPSLFTQQQDFHGQSTHNIGIIIPEIVTTFYMTFINDAQAIFASRGIR